MTSVTVESGRPVTDERDRTESCDVAIVGAGPYGLASAVHLRGSGLKIAGFGEEPMSFWARQMPKGMLLRSPYVACDIGDRTGDLSLPAFERKHSLTPEQPVALTRFIDYGRWVQETVLPDLRRERVAQVSRNGNGFNLTLAGGDRMHADRVVVAAGIADFANYPTPFDELPRHLVSHSVEHDDLGVFAGASVLVIGGGQSALESAALLHENGAHVEVAARAPFFRWLTRRWHHKLPMLSKVLYAWPDVGPAGISQLVAHPRAFTAASRERQIRMTKKALRPAGSAWLVPRLENVPLYVDMHAVEAGETNGGVTVRFANGTERTVDHVLLGTGYRVDVSKYPFLSPELAREIEIADGYPVLGRGMESSVDGLHFMGAPAAWSYGPLMRFVAGSSFAAGELARSVLARAK